MREGAGIGLGIAAAIVTAFALMPVVLVVVLYVFFNVQAIADGSEFGATSIDLRVLFGGIAVVTSALVSLLAVGIALVGKALGPPRRERP